MTQKENKAIHLADYMSNKLVTIDSDTTAFEIANRMMLQKRISALIVMNSAKSAGIITERDLIRQVCAKDSPLSKTPATVLMSTPLGSVDKNSTIERAAEAMARNGIRHLAVENGNKIIGMITTTDLCRYIMEELLDKERVSYSILEVLYPSEEPGEENWL